jgi:hypothetical protein
LQLPFDTIEDLLGKLLGVRKEPPHLRVDVWQFAPAIDPGEFIDTGPNAGECVFETEGTGPSGASTFSAISSTMLDE